MTFLGLARKNAWRKPMRSLLLVLCISVAFLIYGMTASFLNGSQGTSAVSADILGVMSINGRSQPLPMAHLSRLAAMPDIGAAAWMTRVRGFVSVEKNVVSVSAVDPGLLIAVNGPELGLTGDLVDALGKARNRVLVGRQLAEAEGWVTGQSITVTAFDTPRQNGSRNWRFEISGIFDGQTASTDTYFIIARYDYINAERASDRDTVNAFIVRPVPGVHTAELAARIDRLFANSAAPTRTQSEKQFLDAFLRQYADIGMIVDLVVGAAFVTLLMIVINTMVFAVRERRFEIGLLKTLGFSSSRILALILSETLVIFAIGGASGLALARVAVWLAGPDLGLVFSPLILARALPLIVALGLMTGALPAIHALRIPVLNAFRTR